MVSSFGFAEIKREGGDILFDKNSKPSPNPKLETTWIERNVPRSLENELHTLIDNFLTEKGYTNGI